MRRHAIHAGFVAACGLTSEWARAENETRASEPLATVGDGAAPRRHAPPRDAVVVAAAPSSPVGGEIVLNPRATRQAVPASDGADYLSAIAGFAAVGNGGTHGDAVLRGLGGGRLSVLSNGTTTQGACGSRMDSPTAYLSPDSFESVRIVKGPGTVRWGPVALAGTVRFDRSTTRFDAPGLRFHGAVLGGMYGRHDALVDLSVGGPRGDARLVANRTYADDYRDGDNRSVPARWDKWQLDALFNVYVTDRTRLTLEAGTGDGKVRYASRGMDGARFRRDSVAIGVTTDMPGERLRSASAQWYLNRVDHVMDNFSLRTASLAGGAAPAAPAALASPGLRNYRLALSNPGRTLMGGRGELHWFLAPQWSLFTGIDGLTERQTGRFAEGIRQAADADAAANAPPNIGALPRRTNAVQARVGLFAQSEWRIGRQDGVTAGVRIDRSALSDRRQHTIDNRFSARRQAWTSGHFARWEHDALTMPLTFFVGIGQTRRMPDYWELFSGPRGSANVANAFNSVRPEKASQIDLGFYYDDGDDAGRAHPAGGALADGFGDALGPDALRQSNRSGRQAWISAYAASVQDFILFDYAPGAPFLVRNVDARLYGAEAGFSLALHPRWRIDVSSALSMGDNVSDKRPLAQMPPLDTRIGLHYRQGPWKGGLLWRVVAPQRRWAADQGTVAGRDFRASGGFGVLSLNASYAVSRVAAVHVGIDNLLNKTYAEHLNRQGAAGFGFAGNRAFNDPGRMAWAKLIVDL
ncbi:TonB-dependent receptor [Robbsia sp. KACC 23696]|uniref:TonB-dependent receptor domain-containing protein n=1 Tax=Robbsia sp. KACC 23696 TaxID=3149231 RepID=UPI00325A501E